MELCHQAVRRPPVVLTRFVRWRGRRTARLIGRWGSGNREEGGTEADFQGQRTSGQLATGKTKHAIDVTVKAKASERKVRSRSE